MIRLGEGSAVLLATTIEADYLSLCSPLWLCSRQGSRSLRLGLRLLPGLGSALWVRVREVGLLSLPLLCLGSLAPLNYPTGCLAYSDECESARNPMVATLEITPCKMLFPLPLSK